MQIAGITPDENVRYFLRRSTMINIMINIMMNIMMNIMIDIMMNIMINIMMNNDEHYSTRLDLGFGV